MIHPRNNTSHHDMAARIILHVITFILVCQLLQLGEGCGDALHGLANVVVACGIAHAQVTWGAECGTIDSGNMSLVEQI